MLARKNTLKTPYFEFFKKLFAWFSDWWLEKVNSRLIPEYGSPILWQQVQLQKGRKERLGYQVESLGSQVRGTG